ncbi:MAG: tRNA lysidine(34) synthetase TilS [Kiritimatiellae bacterium]|nr:tRNA lysidine(34) synthetase TilS [Kiritimatiellia bacterium]
MEGTVHAFRKNLVEQGLLHGVNRLGVAVSGGADSVALLRLLTSIQPPFPVTYIVIHINHGLRDASDEEEAFVRQLAETCGARFRLFRARLRETPLPAGQSVEMTARQARLAFYRTAFEEERLDAIATAHHADDCAETFLLRLARGAGTSGLTGIKSDTVYEGVRIIRPLLDIPSADLRAYLRAIGQPWREDASNREEAIPRNKIRHQIIPYLETQWDPAFRKHLLQTVDILSEEDRYLRDVTARALTSLQADEGRALCWRDLLALPIALQRRVLREWLFAIGEVAWTSYEQVATVLSFLNRASSGETAKNALTLTDDRILSLSGSEMRVGSPSPVQTPPPPVPLAIPGETRWGAWRFTVEPFRGWVAESHGIGVPPVCFTLSADACAGKRLVIRSRQSGDRIFPTGMTGSRKIKEILIDAKIPESARDTLPVIATDDECVYLTGYRIARTFAVQSPTSPSFLCRADRAFLANR